MPDKSLLRWAKLNVSLVFLPVMLVLAGLYHVASLQKAVKIRAFETDASEALETLRYYSATEQYICTTLAGIFDNHPQPGELRTAVEQFAAAHDIELKFFINDADGGIHYSNFPVEQLRGDLKGAFDAMQTIRRKGYAGGERVIPPEVYKNLRLLYGPHFFPRFYHRCFTGKNLMLRRGYAAADKPLLWLNFSDTGGLSVFLPPEVVESFCGVKFHADDNPGNLITGYIRNGVVHCKDPELARSMHAQAALLQKSLSSIIKLPQHYLMVNYIDSTMTVFCAARTAEIEVFAVSPLTGILAFIMLAGFALVAWGSYLVIVRGRSLSMRLQKQLMLLFIASNALPGFVVFTIGSDYLQQFRAGLLADRYNEGMAYLQSIDELYSNEFTVQKRRIESALSELKNKLKKTGVGKAGVKKFVGGQEPKPYAFYLVASNTGFVASERGVLKDEKLHEAFSPGFVNDKIRINTMKAMFKIGTYILTTLNKQPLSGKAGTEAEIVCETLTQRSPIELIRIFADSGSFSEWGLAAKRHPTYVNLLQLFDRVIFDYLLFYLWDSDDLEIGFIRRIFHFLNRNEYGFKVMAVEDRFYIGFPDEILTDEKLKNFALKLRDRSVARPEHCIYKGEAYLLFGHKCVAMKNIRLLGLYPLHRIEAQVLDKRWLLSLLAFVSLLISVSVGLFIAGSILQPLGELQAGVTALNGRNFAWRVPDLGGDEFGHLARIFNETLIDLEELHVASQVQEKLLTPMPEPRTLGCLRYLCRAGMTTGFSGEYFDLIETGNDQSSLFFGRALEPGVAGSLVLAFIKSATMQLPHLLLQPEKMLGTLMALLQKSRENSGKPAVQLRCLLLHDNGRIESASCEMPAALLYDHATAELRRLENTPAGEITLQPGQSLLIAVDLAGWPENLPHKLVGCAAGDCDAIYKSVIASFKEAGCEFQAALVVCRV
ncbi:MAG TPA: HAMP domain-containing protein [Candidatus Rifleibacterium sp.]|nr:HAMP domain-containing protein [Candidatus Rifleibacterium sp.]HPT44835.1 HAMP domain-containing protein [Candidatus Rifleibacterium sp.]